MSRLTSRPHLSAPLLLLPFPSRLPPLSPLVLVFRRRRSAAAPPHSSGHPRSTCCRRTPICIRIHISISRNRPLRRNRADPTVVAVRGELGSTHNRVDFTSKFISVLDSFLKKISRSVLHSSSFPRMLFFASIASGGAGIAGRAVLPIRRTPREWLLLPTDVDLLSSPGHVPAFELGHGRPFLRSPKSKAPEP